MKFISRKLRTFGNYTSTLGTVHGLRWAAIKGAERAGLARGEVNVHPPALQHPLTLRTNGSSDSAVFDHIFVTKEYEFLDRLTGPVAIMVDLGANIGCASALFLSAFPGAFVLSVEPDPANLEFCRRNLAPYGARSKVVQGAVWHSSGDLVLSRGTFGDGREWATEVRSARPGEKGDVTAFDIPGLMEMCPANRIDLLKIDIEGSEKALFSMNTGWLENVRNLCIELHGPENRQAVLQALSGYHYESGECGEYTLFLNLAAKHAPDSRKP